MNKGFEQEIENFLKTQQSKLEEIQRTKVTNCFDQNATNSDSFSKCYKEFYDKLKRVGKRQEIDMIYHQMNI